MDRTDTEAMIIIIIIMKIGGSSIDSAGLPSLTPVSPLPSPTPDSVPDMAKTEAYSIEIVI